MTLMKAYDEIMGEIKVTPEMRQRVLKCIQKAEIKPTQPNALHLPMWRSYMSVAACLLLIFSGALVLPHLLEPIASPPPVLAQPGAEEADSPLELAGLVGFEIAESFTLPFEANDIEYLAYGNDLAQVTYTGADQAATFRQSPEKQDNSGDYNYYSDVIEVLIDDRTITLKGNDGGYILALWVDGNYSYSLRLSQEVSKEEWLDIFANR